jgi:DNA-binding MarR family transcriptional regulator
MLQQSGENGVPFQELKEDLQLTDSNLATHLRSLEQDGYITFFKVNEGHKTKQSTNLLIMERRH